VTKPKGVREMHRNSPVLFERFQLTICSSGSTDCGYVELHRPELSKVMSDSDYVSASRNHMRAQLKCCELRLKCLLMRDGRIGELEVWTLSFVLCALKFQLIDFEGQSSKHEEQSSIDEIRESHQLTLN
jgi:hypothetical protein